MKRVHIAYELAYGNAYEMGLTGDRVTVNPPTPLPPPAVRLHPTPAKQGGWA